MISYLDTVISRMFLLGTVGLNTLNGSVMFRKLMFL